MAVETKKEEIRNSRGKVIAIIPHCEGESGRCRRDSQEFCECNIFAGDVRYPNRYGGN